MTAPTEFLSYQRARFATKLPVGLLYSPSHYWIARQEQSLWRIGLTKFASRILGEMVDYGFDLKPGAGVTSGQVLGWIEGFKARSDVVCIAEGKFAGVNPQLEESITLINQDPYDTGWLYAVRGQPDVACIDVQGYMRILDETIDRLSKE